MLTFVRPALHAAIELGRPELKRRLSAGITMDADALVAGLRLLHPDSDALQMSATAIRRTILGLALQEQLSVAESRDQLMWLFKRLVADLDAGPSRTAHVRVGR